MKINIKWLNEYLVQFKKEKRVDFEHAFKINWKAYLNTETEIYF